MEAEMTNQPGFPVNPAAGVAAAAMAPSDEEDRLEDADSATDGGVPVGEADARADEERAAGDGDGGGDDDDHGLMPDLLRHDRDDDGVPVGRADAEEDRRRAQADS
jgi:hypothetical protein